MSPATCLPDACFCEAVRTGLIAQPANTWSSLAFVFVGAWILARSPMKVYGAATIAIGLGSAFYHASLTFVGQVADIFGMYLLVTFMLVFRVGRWFGPLYIALNLALLAAQVAFPQSRRYLFAAVIAGVLILETRARGIERKWLYWALAAMSAGFLLWTLDITHSLCDPQSLLQGHAFWHVLGAVAAWCVFRYLQSERTRLA
ncbi:MAG: ceramidase [Acidobacteriota bacterium]|nr:ceramidase [Acidobacteriota bacterium]